VSFSQWFPLTAGGVAGAPDAPAAVQLCTQDRHLQTYPKGKSAMVFYFFAARSAREALLRLFADEIAQPGVRGEGALVFRVWTGDGAREALERLYDEFYDRFGSPPCFNVGPDPDG
jgi:hypothetical protein